MLKRNVLLVLTSFSFLFFGATWMVCPQEEAVAELRSPPRKVVAPGVVEPAQDQVALSFEIPGRIDRLLAEEGDRIEKGQLLATLDDRLQKAGLARAEAALESARARRDLARNGSRDQEIRAAEAELTGALALSLEREQWLSRTQNLIEQKAARPSELDSAKGSADASRAQAEAAEARLKLAREGVRSELRREAQAQVLIAEAMVAEARTLLSKTELHAPKSGVVLRRFAEPGEQVVTTPPRVVLTLADLDHLQLRVEIDETDVGRIQVGQTGYASAEAFGDRRFPGQVVRLSKELGRKALRTDDPRARTDTRILELLFALHEPESLPLGLRLDVHIELGAGR